MKPLAFLLLTLLFSASAFAAEISLKDTIKVEADCLDGVIALVSGKKTKVEAKTDEEKQFVANARSRAEVLSEQLMQGLKYRETKLFLRGKAEHLAVVILCDGSNCVYFDFTRSGTEAKLQVAKEAWHDGAGSAYLVCEK